MKRFLTYIILSLSIPCLYAQNVYIRGYVVDRQNNAIESINVAIKGTEQGTTTNSNGYYQISVNLTGRDTLIYFGLGYKDTIKTLPQYIDKSININVILDRDTTVLTTVGISAVSDNKGNMNEIDTKVLHLTPDAAGGIESLVKMQIGVSSTNELSSQYSVRGGSFDENSVYVNGTEIYRPLLIHSSQQEGLSFVNPDLVGRVNFGRRFQRQVWR